MVKNAGPLGEAEGPFPSDSHENSNLCFNRRAGSLLRPSSEVRLRAHLWIQSQSALAIILLLQAHQACASLNRSGKAVMPSYHAVSAVSL